MIVSRIACITSKHGFPEPYNCSYLHVGLEFSALLIYDHFVRLLDSAGKQGLIGCQFLDFVKLWERQHGGIDANYRCIPRQ